MFPELPLEWQTKLTEELDYVKKHGFYLTDPDDIKKQPKTLSVLLQFDEKYRNEIFNFSKQALPENLKSKIYFQPPEGYHVSIQWSKDYSNVDMDSLCNKVSNYAKKMPTITADLLGLYPSDNNFFFVLNTNAKIAKIREEISEIMTEAGATPKLRKDLATLWVSVARPFVPFTNEEIEQSINSVEKKSFSNVTLDTLIIAKNDPFFDKHHSQVLSEIKSLN